MKKLFNISRVIIVAAIVLESIAVIETYYLTGNYYLLFLLLFPSLAIFCMIKYKLKCSKI